ncbi:MAG: ATP-binding protein [Bacteroidota bacterium]
MYSYFSLCRGLLVCILLSAGPALHAKTQIDSLKLELTQNIQPESRALNLHRLSRIYRNHNPDSAMYFGEQALQQYVRLASTSGIIQSKINLGQIYYKKGLYQIGIGHFLSALSFSQQASLSDKERRIFNSLANGYKHIGKRDSALYFYLEAIKGAEMAQDSLELARVLVNTGSFYQENADLAKSYAYLNRGIRLLKRLKQDRMLGVAYLNRGVSYFQHCENASALSDFQHALSVFKRMGEEHLALQVAGNMALVYVTQEKHHLAVQILHPRIEKELRKEYPDFQILIGLGATLGTALLEQQEYQEAIRWYKESLTYSKQMDVLSQECRLAELLSICYEKQQLNDSALFYHKQFLSLKDSLFNQTQSRKIAELEDKYEAEKKEQIIRLQAVEMESTQLKLYLSSGIGTLLLMLTLVIVLALYQRNKRVLAEADAQRTRVVELLQDKELDWLNAVVEGQEQERQRLGRELHDQMGSNLSALKLAIQQLKHIDGVEAAPFSRIEQLLDHTAKEVRRLSHSMEGGVLAEFGLQQAISELCRILEASSPFHIHLEMFGGELSVSYEVELALFRITQEALTNIVKYADASQVFILLNQEENEILLTIEDNGIGFEWMHVPSANSMGISNMQKRAQKIGGATTIESIPGQGTSVLTSIPLNHSSFEQSVKQENYYLS